MLEPLKKSDPATREVAEHPAPPAPPEPAAPRAQRRRSQSIDDLPSSTFRIPRV